jgi:hypothetical protein
MRTECNAHMWRAIAFQSMIENAANPLEPAFSAIDELNIAATLFDKMRRELTVLGKTRAFEKKQKLVAGGSFRIVRLAIEIGLSHIASSPEILWQWTQYGKARSLADLLGSSTLVPARLVNALPIPVRDYYDRDQRLATEILMADPQRRFTLRKLHEANRQKMECSPELREILSIQGGDSIVFGDVKEFLGRLEQRVACVDWNVCHDQLFMIILCPAEDKPRICPLGVTVTEVREWTALHLTQKKYQPCLFAHV